MQLKYLYVINLFVLFSYHLGYHYTLNQTFGFAVKCSIINANIFKYGAYQL
jgi:hypothetical protein